MKLKSVFFFVLNYSSVIIAQPITLNDAQAAEIGRKIWQNEGSCLTKFLTWWGKDEAFASLGIGHFTWHPKGLKKKINECFPDFLSFAKTKGKKMPLWLKKDPSQPCPWSTREVFFANSQSSKMIELRTFLEETVDLQTQFIVDRFKKTWPEILSKAPENQREMVKRRLHAVAGNPNGMYALVDYLNFKGSGTSCTEQYCEQKWGLLQVLQTMQEPSKDLNAVKSFADAARQLLTRRVENAKRLGKNEQSWLPIWLRRVDTYVSKS